MEIPRFESVLTANFVDEHGGRHFTPATEYEHREPDYSPYDRLIRGLGDEALGSMGVSSIYDVEDLPTIVPVKNLGMSSHGVGHTPKFLK
jgi:hypothetical protein